MGRGASPARGRLPSRVENCNPLADSVHLVGDDAPEIIQAAAIAVTMGATKADFDATMALHPSAAEELVTLRTKWTGD